MDLAYCKDRLSAAGVSFDTGLTLDEFSAIENEYGFHFPPDLREFLAYDSQFIKPTSFTTVRICLTTSATNSVIISDEPSMRMTVELGILSFGLI